MLPPHMILGVAPGGVADTIIVVLNLDPMNVREGVVHLDTAVLGLPDGQTSFEVKDLLSGQSFTWGDQPFFRLDPHHAPGHVVHVRA